MSPEPSRITLRLGWTYAGTPATPEGYETYEREWTGPLPRTGDTMCLDGENQQGLPVGGVWWLDGGARAVVHLGFHVGHYGFPRAREDLTALGFARVP